MINIAIFASGSGSNAENIIKYFKPNTKVSFKSIISNKADAFVHERARKLDLQSITFSKADFENGTVLEYLKEQDVDFIILAGFLLKIPQHLIESYPNRIVNIHPALLPKFGGKGMYGDNVHKAVIDADDRETGITIHYINENYDEGATIFQARCNVEKGDTYKDVANKVHALEYQYFPEIIEQVLIKEGYLD